MIIYFVELAYLLSTLPVFVMLHSDFDCDLTVMFLGETDAYKRKIQRTKVTSDAHANGEGFSSCVHY